MKYTFKECVYNDNKIEKIIILSGCLLIVFLSNDKMFSTKIDNKKITIAVIQFDDQSIGIKNFESWKMGLPEQIMQSLAVIPEFTIVSRDIMLKKIIKKQELQLSGMTDPDSAVKIGNLMNIEYMCTGLFFIFKETLKINAQVIYVQTGQMMCQKSVNSGISVSELAELLKPSIFISIFLSKYFNNSLIFDC